LGNANRWREITKADGSTFTEAEARNLPVGMSVYLPVNYQTGTGKPVTSPPSSTPTLIRTGGDLGLKGQLEALQSKVEELKKEVNKLQEAVNVLPDEIAGIDNEIKRLEKEVENKKKEAVELEKQWWNPFAQIRANLLRYEAWKIENPTLRQLRKFKEGAEKILYKARKDLDAKSQELNPAEKELQEFQQKYQYYIDIYDNPQRVANSLGGFLEDLKNYLPEVIEALYTFGILTRLTLIAAIATIRVETGGFKPITEYGPESYFKQYDGRVALGNTKPGDGYKYRGRGFIQITGRYNYTKYGERFGVDLINNPDLALDPTISAKILAAYFVDRGVAQAANAQDWRGVRRLVNGGYNGWDLFIKTVNNLKARL
jgi:predicted chitinase